MVSTPCKRRLKQSDGRNSIVMRTEITTRKPRRDYGSNSITPLTKLPSAERLKLWPEPIIMEFLARMERKRKNTTVGKCQRLNKLTETFVRTLDSTIPIKYKESMD